MTETECDVSVPFSGGPGLRDPAENGDEAREWPFVDRDRFSDVIFWQVEAWITKAYARCAIKVE
ncbi:MAG: hypothetical protein J5855_01140 [Mailhella sp.]|nr:hypothetical protein [Mailhella sp.]